MFANLKEISVELKVCQFVLQVDAFRLRRNQFGTEVEVKQARMSLPEVSMQWKGTAAGLSKELGFNVQLWSLLPLTHVTY